MTEFTTELAIAEPTGFDIREAALSLAIESVDTIGDPTAADLIARAKEFEAYLRGDDQPEQAAAAEPEQADEACNCPICRPGGLRDLAKTGFLLGPIYPGRSAG
ncbi:hypothetical protein OHA21_43710 [Actinoplanes sp. NBC_00393]|uniref:hypothetical protein n=1 Tax=Actinoplanes sp. NBC_00393 TaxID=2975953 RepID=UPI002E1C4B86